MKILHVITTMNPEMGGVAKAVRTMISGLEKLRTNNEVVCFDSPDAVYLRSDLFPVHALGPGKTPWYYNGKLVFWLMENFVKFDVIIVHGLWLYNGFAVNKLFHVLRKNKLSSPQLNTVIPRIYIMPHGMLDPYFQLADNRKLKALRNWVYWKLIESKVVNNADGIFFTCEEERRLAKKTFRPYSPKAEVVVGLGVEGPPPYTDEIRNAFIKKCPEVENRAYLLFLGRIHEKKGVDLLVMAYAKLLKEKLQVPMLVIGGPGMDSTYGRSIRQMVLNNSELNKVIVFPGMLDGDVKWGAFSGCQAFVLPSHQENFGIAVVEALACSKPVLITNKINIWERINYMKSGIIAPDTFEGVYFLLLNWISKSTDEKKYLNSRAIDLYEEEFSVESSAIKLKNALSV